jgi:hypothetical protein
MSTKLTCPASNCCLASSKVILPGCSWDEQAANHKTTKQKPSFLRKVNIFFIFQGYVKSKRKFEPIDFGQTINRIAIIAKR